MSLNNSEKKYPCPPDALFRPSRFRLFYFPFSLVACWAAVFFKARTSESWPWQPLLMATLFVIGILVLEIFISTYFAKYLALAIYGFLLGTGANVLIQGLLGRFQGLNWAFQSPIQFSLGTVLLGFLGSLIFISHDQEIREFFVLSAAKKEQSETSGSLRSLLALLWALTALMALGLCVNLVVIRSVFSEFDTANPLRKPFWFSAATILLIFLVAVLARKNLLRLGRILLPGIIVGLVWASVVQDLFAAIYLEYPKFPLSLEVLEVLLVINFCFLGLAWLNKATCGAKETRQA